MLIFIKKKNTPPQPIREVYFPWQKIYKKETINFLISNYRNYLATAVIQILYRGYIHICFNFFSLIIDKFYFISFIFCGEKVNYFLYYCFHFWYPCLSSFCIYYNADEMKCQEFFQKYFLFFVSLWWVLYHIYNELSIYFSK